MKHRCSPLVRNTLRGYARIARRLRESRENDETQTRSRNEELTPRRVTLISSRTRDNLPSKRFKRVAATEFRISSNLHRLAFFYSLLPSPCRLCFA